MDVTRRASVGFVGLHSGVFTSCQVLRIIQGQRSSPQLHAELIFFQTEAISAIGVGLSFLWFMQPCLKGKKNG